MSNTKRFHYAWIVLLAVSLIRGIAGPGINASMGLFLTPVSEEIGVGIGQLSISLSISSVTMLLWLPLAGRLLSRYPARAVAAVSSVVQCAAFLALGLFQSVWGFYLMAIPLAMGAALLVNLLGPVLISRWFAAKNGLVIGIMMTITSLVGALLQPLFTRLIAEKGWRFTYFVCGLAALVIMTALSLLLLRSKPEDKGLRPYGKAEVHEQQAQGVQSAGVPVNKAMKSAAFYMLVVFMIALTGFAAFSQHITTYGINLGFPITTVGTALSLFMVGSAIGSILIGVLSDRIGAVATGLGVTGVGLLSVLLFLWSGHVFVIFAIASFLFGLATSAIGVLAPTLTSFFFGARDYEKLFSYVMMGAPFASILLLPLYGFLYDHFGSYRIVLLLLLAAMIIAAVSLLIGNKRRPSAKEV